MASLQPLERSIAAGWAALEAARARRNEESAKVAGEPSLIRAWESPPRKSSSRTKVASVFDKTAGGGSLAKDALAAAAADKEAILAAVAELRAELKDVGSVPPKAEPPQCCTC